MIYYNNLTDSNLTIDMNGFAVVTGASSGLGRCFAVELARRGINTILVALPGSGVKDAALEAGSYGTDSIAFEADLTDKKAILEVCTEIAGRYPVNILINNAGCGGTRKFLECDEEYIDRILGLNVMAVTTLTHQLLPVLQQQNEAYILNVSSMAAFTPIGYKTVYPASKRFIYDFTRGLHEEFSGSGISVSVIHPGPMKTNADVTRRIERQGRFGRIGLLSPEEVARRGIDGMLKREAVIIPGLVNKLNKVLTDIIPARIRLPLVSRIVARELQL